jgi:hypothetical protein
MLMEIIHPRNSGKTWSAVMFFVRTIKSMVA